MSIDRDDAFLDTLASGQSIPDDQLATLFSAWTADLTTDALPALNLADFGLAPNLAEDSGRAAERDATGLTAIPAPRRPTSSARGAQQNAGRFEQPLLRPSGGSAAGEGKERAAGGANGPRRSRFRVSRPALVAALTAALAFGGLTVASAGADPGSPLWPLTRIFFNDKADSRQAEQDARQLLSQAETAANAGDHTKALSLLDSARVHIGQITDPVKRTSLTAQADALLAKVTATLGLQASASAAPSPGATGGTGTTGQPGAPGGPGTGPTPSPSHTGLLPPILPSILPSGLLPSLPLPLPLPHL